MKPRISAYFRRLVKEGCFTERQIIEKFNYYGGLCWLCRSKKASAIDHTIPQNYKVINHLANLRPICKPCNSTKNNNYPVDFEMLKAKLFGKQTEKERLKAMATILLSECGIKKWCVENNKRKVIRNVAPDIAYFNARLLANEVLRFLEGNS